VNSTYHRAIRNFLVGVALVSISFPGTARPAAAGELAVLMSAPVDPYREALSGFSEVVGRPVGKIHHMNGKVGRGKKAIAQFDPNAPPDLIFAVGITALQAVLAQPTDIPVIFAMVLNPDSIVGSQAANITGASMNVPASEILRVLEQMNPKIRKLGVVYNESKTGSLIAQAKELAAGAGIEILDRRVSSPKEAIKALDALQHDGIDAFWFVPDETILAPAVTKQVFLVSHRNGIPVVGLSKNQARMGAVLSLSFASSEDIGRQAGELALAVLGGKSPASVPMTNARKVSLTVNLKAARKLGLEIPESVLVAANDVIQ
jgi:putative ABC transport system substrate-binding protein